MAEDAITEADIEGLANKLDGLRDRFTDREHDTLQVVFRLAGTGLTLETHSAEALDVAGFVLTPEKPEAGNENIHGRGLHAQFSLGLSFISPAPGPVPLPYPNIT